jgi:hypothetical protein
VAGILGIITFVGIKTVNDISNRLEPVVAEAEQRAKARIASLKASLDQLAQDVTTQTSRVSTKNGEISKEFLRLDALSNQIDGMVQSLQNNVQQVSKQVDILSVRKAYPTLGLPKIVTFEGRPWVDHKKMGDNWVNIYIGPTSVGEFAPQQIDNLVASLKTAGYSSYLGLFGVSGPISQGFGPLGDFTGPIVFYFDKAAEKMATEVAALVYKNIAIKTPTQFIDASKLLDNRKFIIPNSGLDLQIYLYRRPQ